MPAPCPFAKVIYGRIETLLAAQVPVIFLYRQPRLYLQPASLKGFDPNAFDRLISTAHQWQY